MGMRYGEMLNYSIGMILSLTQIILLSPAHILIISTFILI